MEGEVRENGKGERGGGVKLNDILLPLLLLHVLYSYLLMVSKYG